MLLIYETVLCYEYWQNEHTRVYPISVNFFFLIIKVVEINERKIIDVAAKTLHQFILNYYHHFEKNSLVAFLSLARIWLKRFNDIV